MNNVIVSEKQEVNEEENYISYYVIYNYSETNNDDTIDYFRKTDYFETLDELAEFILHSELHLQNFSIESRGKLVEFSIEENNKLDDIILKKENTAFQISCDLSTISYGLSDLLKIEKTLNEITNDLKKHQKDFTQDAINRKTQEIQEYKNRQYNLEKKVMAVYDKLPAKYKPDFKFDWNCRQYLNRLLGKNNHV